MISFKRLRRLAMAGLAITADAASCGRLYLHLDWRERHLEQHGKLEHSRCSWHVPQQWRLHV
jgi:hypothetical protein